MGGPVARHGFRWLVAGAERFAWSVGHAHEVAADADAPGGRRLTGCRELVRLRREGARGQLVVVFRDGDGNVASGGMLHAGAVMHADGRSLNLNEPGVVRALLDEALARGWQPALPSRSELDGWTLFDAVAARRASSVGPTSA